jgi:hypothetical protein
MKALPVFLYRDPLEVAIAREAQSCKGCAHEQTYEFGGRTVKICGEGKAHGSRCKTFREKK